MASTNHLHYEDAVDHMNHRLRRLRLHHKHQCSPNPLRCRARLQAQSPMTFDITMSRHETQLSLRRKSNARYPMRAIAGHRNRQRAEACSRPSVLPRRHMRMSHQCRRSNGNILAGTLLQEATNHQHYNDKQIESSTLSRVS